MKTGWVYDSKTGGYVQVTAQTTILSTTATDNSGTPTPSPTKTFSPFSRSTYQLGETASNGLIKVTVSNKRFIDSFHITGPTGKQESLLATRGQWLILEVTVENIQPDNSATVRLNQFILIDDSEGTHQSNPSFSYPDHRLVSANLAPGQKITGDIAFQVTKNPNNIQLEFSDLSQSQFAFSGSTATFNI